MPEEKYYGIPTAFSINLGDIREETDLDETQDSTHEGEDDYKEESVTPTPLTATVVEEEEDEKVETDEDDDPYVDYSEAAKIAIAEIKSGTFELDEKLIPKDLDLNTLRNLYKKNNELVLKEEIERVSEQAGEAAKYVQYLLEGGDVEAVKSALQVKDLLKLDPSNEDDQKKLITEELRQKGLPQDEIDDLLDTILDKGKGKTRAEQALKTFQDLEDQTLEYYKQQQEAAEQAQREAYTQYVSDIKQVIEKGEVGGVKLDKKEQRQVFEALFTPTEIVSVKDPSTGRDIKTKVTKIQALQNELNNNREKIVAFALWLLKDGNFDFAKEQGRAEEQDTLLSVLNGKSVDHSKKHKKRETSFNSLVDALTRR